jgi:hypothetical protein
MMETRDRRGLGDRLMGIPSNNGGQTLFEEKPELAGGRHQFIDQTSTIYLIIRTIARRNETQHYYTQGSRYLISTHSMIYLYSL